MLALRIAILLPHHPQYIRRSSNTTMSAHRRYISLRLHPSAFAVASTHMAANANVCCTSAVFITVYTSIVNILSIGVFCKYKQKNRDMVCYQTFSFIRNFG